MPKSLFSYVVRYDSGFAPNPFFGFCTLATCKPDIRKAAQKGDWIVGTGSASKAINRGGHLVFAMRVSETPSTAEYWSDSRFKRKRASLYGGLMVASGDNIYEPIEMGWKQLNSYHSNPNGTPNHDHIRRDTSVQRVLVSDRFIYCGAQGDRLPDRFQPDGEFPVVMTGIGYRRKKNLKIIAAFEEWFETLPETGLRGEPWDWLHRNNRRKYF
ncbi:hypothetical protein [Hwanghaeella sp. LZ110]|uniref:Nmad2 family putative nucleotide modification protein n=1 Tax=Hwanghaeella sp. LZ110 TaxID=3402810 RepID=UPI003B6763D9